MKYQSQKPIRSVKEGIALALFAFVFAAAGFAAPRAVNAQMAVADAPVLGALVGSDVKRDVLDVIVESATVAVTNAVNYFTSQLAYQLAVSITSDCPGQKNCWTTKAWNQNLKEAAQGAAGEAIGSLSQELLGSDFLCSPNVDFVLKIQLGLMRDNKPKPRCDFKAISESWSTLYKSVESGDLLKKLVPVFEPGQSPLGYSIDVMDGMYERKDKAEQEAIMNKLADAAAGGGFSGVADVISGRVKAPQTVVKKQFEQAYEERATKPKDYNQFAAAGAIAKGAVKSIFMNMASTFTQTLIANSFNKLVNGLLSTDEILALQPDIIFDRDGALVPGKSGVETAIESRYVVAPVRDTGAYDPTLEFTTCPGSNPQPNNCVMDSQFSQAVRVGDVFPVRVREAIEKGMLHKDWPLIPSTVVEKDRDPFCFTYGYCESNLKKLRAARIIPIGWEIAASKSPANGYVTLGQVIAGFNVCNAQGEADSQHPWCHMIDPEWVIKQPPTMCRAMVYGPTLLSPQSSSRAEYCADAPSCLRQDDTGACIGGWGYCQRERNVWRFNGDQCPAYYASCRALSMRNGSSVSYLMNTVQPGVCNASNVGCTDYYTARKLDEDPQNLADDWAADIRYLNAQAGTCSPNDNGCTAVIPLKQGQSLNLIRNGSFEELGDGDGNGSPDHPKYWSPYGSVGAGGAGYLRGDGERSIEGQNAMRVRAQSGNTQSSLDENTNSCTGTPGTCEKTVNSIVRTCRIIPNGPGKCSITDRVAQDGITLRRGATYTMSAVFRATGESSNVGGRMDLMLFDATRQPVDASDLLAKTTTLTGGPTDATLTKGTPGALPKCSVKNGVTPNTKGIRLEFSGTAYDPQQGIRVSCTFSVDADIASGMLELFGSESNDMFVDAVQLEEGPLTSFHEEYGDAGSVEYRKMPPEYLGCTGEASDRAECKGFTQYCRENEIGCSRFTPKNGDPSVPAIINPQDRCPAECAGYDVFKQEATIFHRARFPEYFIPDTAQRCSASESGCSEFTDLKTEEISYYSRLRLCEQPSSDPATVFYSWEGSDTAGFQLKSWNLKRTSAEVDNRQGTDGMIVDGTTENDQKRMSDIGVSVTSNETVGHAPCTTLALNGLDCASIDSIQVNGSVTGLCSRKQIEQGDLDCREFYDADGGRHYRLLSSTILLTNDCREYRITASNQIDCQNSNGRWLSDRQQCVYSAHLKESTSCNSRSKGCRPYTGSAANNVRTAIFETFESGDNGWAGGSISEDSVVAGGHSFRLENNVTASKEVADLISESRLYSVSFWAHGSGTIAVRFRNGTAQVDFPMSLDLSSTWRRFEIGPVNTNVSWLKDAGTHLEFVRTGSNFAFIDNISLKEVQDSIYVVKNSWKTPFSCDSTYVGTPSAQEMLGCREYKDMNGQPAFLRSFSQICRDKSVGCAAYSDTQKTVENPYAESYNAACILTAACSATGAVAGTCPCNYSPLQPAVATNSSKVPNILPDVCRVPIGETFCRFHLEDAIDNQPVMAGVNDHVAIPSDKRIYIIPDDTHRCAASALGCREVGIHKDEYLGTAAYPSIVGWRSGAVLDNPAKYDRTLCLANAVSCEEFRSNDGVFYFKHPQASVCEFKENVSYQGQVRNGWFRKTTTGAIVPCASSLLKNGDFYDLYRNDDPQYLSNGGWVGECTPDKDRCEELIDPAVTSPANPNGLPYYYLMNSKIDTKSCAGSGSLKEGCVLFQRTGNPARTMSAIPTYVKSESSANGLSVAPVNCNVSPLPQACVGVCETLSGSPLAGTYCRVDPGGQGHNEDCLKYGLTTCWTFPGYGLGGNHPNDANIIIKVRPDRECAEWLTCSASESLWDKANGQWKNVCTQIDACTQQRAVGDSQECSKWSDVPVEILTDKKYSKRDITYGGWEFSGYSLPFKYPVQYVSRVTKDGAGNANSYGVAPDQDLVVKDKSECPSSDMYVGMDGRCYYDIKGHEFFANSSLTDLFDKVSSCRGFPEADAPFDHDIIQSGNKIAGFREANVCEDGLCGCSYQRVGFGPNGSLVKFGTFGSVASVLNTWNGICSGGSNDGKACSVPDTALVCGKPEDGGSCLKRSVVTTVNGWEGFCVDPDYSYNVGGADYRHACNLWLPVDRISGATDLNNQDRGAGFADTNHLLYCSAAWGTTASNYEYILENQVTTFKDSTIASWMPRKDWLPYSMTKIMWFTTRHPDDYMERRVQTITNPAWNYARELTAGIHVTVNAGGESESVSKGATLDFFLTRDNMWTFGVDFGSDEKPPKGTKYSYSPDVSCLNNFDSGNADTTSEAGTHNSLCIKAIWKSDGNLDGFKTVLIHDDDGGATADARDFFVNVSLLQRDACFDVALVNDANNATLHNAAWTDRIYRGYVSTGYDFPHDKAPFGSIKIAPQSVSNTEVVYSATDSKDSDFPLTIWQGEGGSPYVNTYVKNDNGVQSWAHDSGVTASGLPYSCIGACGTSTYSVPVAWQNQFNFYPLKAIDNLDEMFAIGWKLFAWSRASSKYVAISPDSRWDSRILHSTVSTAPQVHAVNTSACVGSDANCPEGPEGLTVSNFMSGNLMGTGGKFKASIKFYAWANENHMPIRKRVVKFGDNSEIDDVDGNSSYYKNRHGCYTGANGTCLTGDPVCLKDVNPLLSFGLQPQACETGYFTVNHTYRCTTKDIQDLGACSPSSGYPCKRTVDVPGQGAKSVCVFQPKVRVVDNWGQCNGVCQGGADGTSVCINNKFDYDFDTGSGDCKDMGSGAWTYFAGEIRVAP